MDAQAAANLLRIRAEADSVAAEVAGLRARVGQSVQRNWAVQLGLSAAILLAGSLLVTALATRMGRVLRALAAEMERVARLDFAGVGGGAVYGARQVDEVVALSRSFALMEMNLLSFSRYVPDRVVRLLANKATVAHLGVQPRDVSVMFSDIVGFSTLAETLVPEVLIGMLAEYLEEMSSCVEATAGTVGELPLPPRHRAPRRLGRSHLSRPAQHTDTPRSSGPPCPGFLLPSAAAAGRNLAGSFSSQRGTGEARTTPGSRDHARLAIRQASRAASIPSRVRDSETVRDFQVGAFSPEEIASARRALPAQRPRAGCGLARRLTRIARLRSLPQASSSATPSWPSGTPRSASRRTRTPRAHQRWSSSAGWASSGRGGPRPASRRCGCGSGSAAARCSTATSGPTAGWSGRECGRAFMLFP